MCLKYSLSRSQMFVAPKTFGLTIADEIRPNIEDAKVNSLTITMYFVAAILLGRLRFQICMPRP